MLLFSDTKQMRKNSLTEFRRVHHGRRRKVSGRACRFGFPRDKRSSRARRSTLLGMADGRYQAVAADARLKAMLAHSAPEPVFFD